MANLPPVLKQYWTDANGNPLAGGKIYTYAAGTTTPQATYTDSGAGTASANPIILDASGFADMWLDPTLSYKFVVKDSSDVTQHTIDNVIGLLTANAVGTASIQDDAVTTAKIADDAVGADQLKDSVAVDADRAVTTNHIRNDAVTLAKLADQSIARAGTLNIGLAAGTTTNANDSIKITGASAALSSTNPGIVVVPSSTPGQLAVFEVTADVTINLTGAQWGEGTKGDLTDYVLSVYAINDSGTLKWGVGSVPNHALILNADDTATASSVTSAEKVLVNSALTADSTCTEIGWFKANFDDTGGASEDLWAVQTGAGDIRVGVRPPMWQKYTPAFTGFGTVNTQSFWWRRLGDSLQIKGRFVSGTSTATEARIGLPGSVVVDPAKVNGTLELGAPASVNASGATTMGWMTAIEPSVNYVCIGRQTSTTDYQTKVQASSLVAASGVVILTPATIPITGWDY
jgi:hypothetical protein